MVSIPIKIIGIKSVGIIMRGGTFVLLVYSGGL